MSRPILNSRYWANRLKRSRDTCLHHSIFYCPLEEWEEIENVHRSILANTISSDSSILDVGCGWGRLLTLLPRGYHGVYLGIDLSPEFLSLAKREHVSKQVSFVLHDITKPVVFELPVHKFDFAVLISIRPMIKRELGGEVWDTCESNIRQICEKILYLEYDVNDPGHLE